MKIREIERKPDDYGDGELLTIEVDGKERVAAGHGEPEDNYLFRDLNFVYNIVPLMQEAYEAGKRGETFEVTREKSVEE